MSTFFAINTALKGMNAQQIALNVASNNIANANTDGYTRQRANMVESPTIAGVGSGVDVADITRIRDEFVDSQIRTETSTLEYETTIADTLENVQTVFNESTDDTGLNSQLSDFWSAWEEVVTTPESTSVRTALVETATTLTDTIRQISDQLTDIQDDVQTQTDLQVEDVNSIADRISELNDQIVYAQNRGDACNDLLDSRDLLLDELSALGNTTVTKCQDVNGEDTGAIEVQLGTLTIVDADGAYEITSDDVTTANIADGSLAALAELAGDGDNSIQHYKDELDTLAVAIAKTVNDIHTTGTDLDGQTGEDFFVFEDADGNVIDLTSVDWSDPFASGLGAANIYVNPDIEDDVSKVAASSDGTDGNSDIALQIADLADIDLEYDSANQVLENTGSGDTTLGDFYANIVTELGSAISRAQDSADSQQTLVDELTETRESVSGVSLDEETASVILYQSAYDACAKVISIMDEMLDTLINGMI